MPGIKSQNAIELMTTYSYVILIVTLAIGVTFLYYSIPTSVIPVQCSFYSGFICQDAALYVVPGGANELVVIATSTQPGIVNTTGFNSVLNQAQSQSGFCTTNGVVSQVRGGQKIYCVAYFGFAPKSGTAYYGTFTVYASYCAGNPANISNDRCPSSRNYTFAGSIRIQPTLVSSLSGVNAIISTSVTTLSSTSTSSTSTSSTSLASTTSTSSTSSTSIQTTTSTTSTSSTSLSSTSSTTTIGEYPSCSVVFANSTGTPNSTLCISSGTAYKVYLVLYALSGSNWAVVNVSQGGSLLTSDNVSIDDTGNTECDNSTYQIDTTPFISSGAVVNLTINASFAFPHGIHPPCAGFANATLGPA